MSRRAAAETVAAARTESACKLEASQSMMNLTYSAAVIVSPRSPGFDALTFMNHVVGILVHLQDHRLRLDESTVDLLVRLNTPS